MPRISAFMEAAADHMVRKMDTVSATPPPLYMPWTMLSNTRSSVSGTYSETASSTSSSLSGVNCSSETTSITMGTRDMNM